MDYSRETIFHLPGIFEKVRVNQKLIWLYENKPEVFRDNVKIGSFYGAPGCAIWNGGRFIRGYYTKTELEMAKQFMEERKIPVRFTFSNCMIEEKHLNDTYCNLILDIFNNGNNEIICNSPILEKYLREKYGNNYRYISSTTKRLNNKEQQKEELQKDYYLVVIDYDHNDDDEYLRQLENKDKVEILCNAVCNPKCPNRTKHYKSISECQINFDPDGLFTCPDDKNTFYQIVKSPKFVSVERIEELTAMGFKNFKLEGRTADELDLIDILVYYLIKDEWQGLVRHDMQMSSLT